MNTSENKKKYNKLSPLEKSRLVTGWLEERKGSDIVGMDVSETSSIADVFILVSATSVRHAQGLADHILDMAAEHNLEYLNMEGHKNGQWILLDLNDILVHIFHEDARDFYDLEGMWSKSPRLDLGLTETGLSQGEGKARG